MSELKPCPWCGKLPFPLFPDKRDSNHYRCGNFQCLHDTREQWNLAYCWKREAELLKEIGGLKDIVEASTARDRAREKENAKLFSLANELAKKLKLVRSYDTGTHSPETIEDIIAEAEREINP